MGPGIDLPGKAVALPTAAVLGPGLISRERRRTLYQGALKEYGLQWGPGLISRERPWVARVLPAGVRDFNGARD